MIKPYYRFSIRKSETIYYRINNGSVVDGTDIYYLNHAPAGWEDTEVTEGRSNKYYGYTRAYSAPYKFVLDGAKILRHVWFNQGMEGVAMLYVELLNPTTQEYEFLFKGDLNFAKAVDERDYFQIEILEAGLAAILKANEDIDYTIPIDNVGTDKITVKIPSLKLKGTARWTSVYPPAAPGALNGPDLNVYELLLEEESVNNPVTANSTDNSFYLMEVNQDIYDFAISGSLNYFVNNNTSGGGAVTITFNVILQIGATNYTLKTHTLSAGDDHLDSVTIDIGPLDLPAGTNIRFFIDSNGPGNPPGIDNQSSVWENGCKLSVEYFYYSPEFNVTGNFIKTAGRKLIEQITNGTATLQSDIFTIGVANSNNYDCNPKNLVVISGDSIRGLPSPGYEVPGIKTTLAKYFKAGNVIQNTGLGYSNNKVIIEKREYFYQNVEIADLGEVKSCSISQAEEYLFNSIRIGCEAKDYDQINGRDEYNNTHVYKLPFNRVKEELDLVSPYGHDIYGIFYTWANYRLQNDLKVDSQRDNDVFIIEVSPNPVDGVYQVYRPTGTITGIQDPVNSYNISLTPKRCFMRHGNNTRSVSYGKENAEVTFQSADKNAALVSNIGSGIITENSNVRIDTLRPAYYKPYKFKVEVKSPDNYLRAIVNTPYGYFSFKYQGKKYKGYPLKSGIRPMYPILYTFELLCTADTDISTLVR